MKLEGLTEGRIVHYVLPDGRNQGEHRPAIVVRNWGGENGLVNLQVFLDGSNDNPTADHESGGVMWVTSVSYSEKPIARSWHWIEKA